MPFGLAGPAAREIRGRPVARGPGRLLLDHIGDVLDADDAPLAVTPENKRRLLADPAVLVSLDAAYIEAVFGGRARKN